VHAIDYRFLLFYFDPLFNDEAQRSPRSGDPLQRLVRRFIHSALIIPKYAIKDGTR